MTKKRDNKKLKNRKHKQLHKVNDRWMQAFDDELSAHLILIAEMVQRIDRLEGSVYADDGGCVKWEREDD